MEKVEKDSLNENIEMEKVERFFERKNWRCKIKAGTSSSNRVSKRLKPNCLMQCADWDFVETNRTIGIPLLKNGSLCNAAIINKEHIVVRETCAFDSIFQIVASSMDIYSIYKTNMTALMTFNDFIKILIKILIKNFNKKMY